jgi:hypothetical protein
MAAYEQSAHHCERGDEKRRYANIIMARKYMSLSGLCLFCHEKNSSPVLTTWRSFSGEELFIVGNFFD